MQRYQNVAIVGPFKDAGTAGNGSEATMEWTPTVPARASKRGVTGGTSPNSLPPTINAIQVGTQPATAAPPHYIPPPSIYPDHQYHTELQTVPAPHDVNTNHIKSPRCEVKLNSMP